MTIVSISFTLFLIMNSLGLIPPILNHIQEKPMKEQRMIILREMFIALIIIFLFNFLGEWIFGWLNIKDTTIEMAGGLILFIIAVRMIFPGPKLSIDHQKQEDLFIVPIAVPFVASPSLLAAVMVFARHEGQISTMIISILIATFFTTIVFLLAPSLRKLIGDKGLTAFQRLMGLLLTLMAVQMFLRGISKFITTTFFVGA